MDTLTTVTAVVAPTLAAVGAALRVAWGEWRKDRDVTVQTLQATIASAVDREKAVAVALERSTRALEGNSDAFERAALVRGLLHDATGDTR